MSAECHKCGSDLVYPEGMWPLGECPVCLPTEERDALRILLAEAETALRLILEDCPAEDSRHGDIARRALERISRT